MLRKQSESATRWRQTAQMTLRTAKRLRNSQDHRSCVSRAYYAAYQAATSVCIAHGDAVNFPPDWNNPTHEQLPDLIANNGNLTVSTRRTVKRILRELRSLREDADYRVSKTVDIETVLVALARTTTVFELLEIEDDDH